jgi:Na+/H+-dicarboxylate symporter
MNAILRECKKLHNQVILATILGIAVGALYPDVAVPMKPLADGFIKLIKMIASPIIFGTVAMGIAQTQDIKSLGRVGLKALIYFEVITTLALLLGMVIGYVAQPGVGLNVDVGSLNAASVAGFAKTAQSFSTLDFFMNMIPDTFVGAFAKGDILPVVILGCLAGVALVQMGDKGRDLAAVLDQSLAMLFKIVVYLIKLAPLAAFGAMAFTVGRYGLVSLVAYGKLMATFYITCLVFVLVILGAVMRLCGLRITRLLAFLKDELLITFGAASTEPALPRLISQMEKLGCRQEVVGLVIPAGYAFNVDGVCIYLTMAVVFIAQATNTHLSFAQEFAILLIGMFSTKGMSGTPGAGFVALAATLSAVDSLPLAAMALLVGIDRFMGIGRALTSIIGNAVATVVVAKWENAFDMAQAEAVLSGRSKAGVTDARPPAGAPLFVGDERGQPTV